MWSSVKSFNIKTLFHFLFVFSFVYFCTEHAWFIHWTLHWGLKCETKHKPGILYC